MREDAVPATILVVDDERPLLRLLARVLEGKGYTVLTAIDGDEAVDLFDKHLDVIDGVLLDVVIPPNGIAEVLDHMLSKRSDLAVILSSGDFPDSEISDRVTAQGGAFLRKPFLPKALLDLVATVVQAKRQDKDSANQQASPGSEHDESGSSSDPDGNEA